MPDAISSILTGDVVERVRALELFARVRVEGSRLGDNRSPLLGLSPEFVQHRQYLHGDSLRHVDWRILAKTDRMMTKRFQEFTNTRVAIALDISGSMSYRGLGFTKHEYALRCAAILFYLLSLQRDAFSLCLFTGEAVEWTDSGSSRRHLAQIFERLVSSQAAGTTTIAPSLERIQLRLNQRGLLVVFSDFMDDPAAIASSLGRLRVRGHDVIAFQVIDPSERELDFVDFTQFRDLEDGTLLAADPLLIREEYRKRFLAHQLELKEQCLAHGIDHAALEVSDHYDAMLGDFLRRRGVGVR